MALACWLACERLLCVDQLREPFRCSSASERMTLPSRNNCGMVQQHRSTPSLQISSHHIRREVAFGLDANARWKPICFCLTYLRLGFISVLTVPIFSRPAGMPRTTQSPSFRGIMNNENLESIPVGLFKDTTEVVTL